ncbi:MAG: AAA family ATPase [Gemmatimonadetes bacterium]|nr:AAA family ATPase [Gemmatimonadota bacterium]
MKRSRRPSERGEHALALEELHRVCDPVGLGFRSTAEIRPLDGALGQDDAMDALAFGVSVPSAGYNLFVLGRPGSGRRTFVRQALTARAAAEPTPPDWCYVFNFRDARRPRAVRLPSGRALAFQRDVRDLIADLRRAIPQALEAEDVASRRAAIVEEREEVAAKALDQLQRELELDPYAALVRSGDALVVVPARGGEPVERETYVRFPEELREEIDRHVRDARSRAFAVQRRIHELQREARDRVAELNREIARGVGDHRIAALKERYAGSEGVARYLDELGDDAVEHTDEFIRASDDTGDVAKLIFGGTQEEFLRRYQVNPLVTHAPGSGAPVIEESNPNLVNLLGRMEGQMRFGVMVTDFTRIAPGAVHRANGGYLVLDAGEVLTRPLAWPALKRTLRTRELRPADPGAELGVLAMESLEPEPIPAALKVVLIGDPFLYYLLQALDTEFPELFKAKVDFAPHMDRTPEAEQGYARFIAAQCARESLLPFEAEAAARVIEEGSRVAGDQRRLTTRFREIVDLVREAAYVATAEERATVGAADVERALEARHRRNTRPHRELLELIDRGILRFEPRGEAAGQLYGIGLIAVNENMFGRPIRVMASAYLGTLGVINIEREARLSGPIHSKGFLVMSGYLGRRFARGQPLILSASLSFDQLYEEVEGDSASAAELYALLSAISGVPLQQGMAVTGAVNQEGVILPVGGVTQKVEGFFAACERVGLTGEQGVVLPRANVENLVLCKDVRNAVAADRFHIHAIDRIEDGWPILAGLSAGEPSADGSFPERTVYGAVMDQLSVWAEQWERLGEAGATGAQRATLRKPGTEGSS